MASYSAVTAQNLPPSDVSSPRLVNRQKTVRFKFEVLPDKQDFLGAVLALLDPQHVKCVQTLPGARVDLTLRHDDNVTDIIHTGIELLGETWYPKPLGFRTTYAYVQYLPSEMTSVQVGEAMERFGRVFSVKRQLYEGTTIETGTRIVSLEVTSRIPSYVYIGSYRAKIWHRGQVQTCAKCQSTEHFAKDCPKVNLPWSIDNNTTLIERNPPVLDTEETTPKQDDTTASKTDETTQLVEENQSDTDSDSSDDSEDDFTEGTDDEEHTQATDDNGSVKHEQQEQQDHDQVLDRDLEVNRPVKRALAPSTPTKTPGQKPPNKRRKKKDKKKAANNKPRGASAPSK